MNRNLLFWLITIAITLASVVYQRMTGPTYPLSGKVTLGNETIKYKLIRTYGGPDDAGISISEPGGKINGTIAYRRYKSNDEWTSTAMIHQGGKLTAALPHQPPAGKVMYIITLTDGSSSVTLTKDPVVLRFKGDVPAGIMIPHIILMFLAMLFSSRAGIEAVVKGPGTVRMALLTLIFLIAGGLILGPMVQKYAFGEYWTGWPFGKDLTDNKTAFALFFWIIAVISIRKNKEKQGWAIVAAIVMLLVYLIPHSMFGSEIDYTALPK